MGTVGKEKVNPFVERPLVTGPLVPAVARAGKPVLEELVQLDLV